VEVGVVRFGICRCTQPHKALFGQVRAGGKVSRSEKTFKPSEVSQHKSDKDAWLIIDGGVYDVTPFLVNHPGGKKILLNACGKDSSKQFWNFHSKKVYNKTAAPLLIGKVEHEEQAKL